MKKRSRRKLRIDVALNEAQTPAFLLDAARRIIFFNAGCEALTGWTAEDVVGTVCEYQSESQPTSVEGLAASLCPPPEVYAGEQATAPANLTHRAGRSYERLLHFFPLTDAAGNVGSVLGIANTIEKPLPPARVSLARQLHAELAALRAATRQRYQRAGFIGDSSAMQRVMRQIDLVANSRLPLLLCGESGTGKEHVARMIHGAGDQRGGAFVPVNCRELPTREVKSILRRMFDGGPTSPSAAGLRPSTLFLAHVELLARDVQEMLVDRFAGMPVGEATDLRLIAATTADLAERLNSEDLRSDFFYLLTGLQIVLPPLRERADEIPLLSQAFLEAENRRQERQIGGFTPAVADQFRQYRWPGNLDELRTVISESRAGSTGTLLDIGDLPFRFRTGLDAQAVGPPVTPAHESLETLLATVETEHIQSALEQVRYNKTRAAKLLGLTRARLYRRMESLGIEDREGTED